MITKTHNELVGSVLRDIIDAFGADLIEGLRFVVWYESPKDYVTKVLYPDADDVTVIDLRGRNPEENLYSYNEDTGEVVLFYNNIIRPVSQLSVPESANDFISAVFEYLVYNVIARRIMNMWEIDPALNYGEFLFAIELLGNTIFDTVCTHRKRTQSLPALMARAVFDGEMDGVVDMHKLTEKQIDYVCFVVANIVNRMFSE